MFNLNHVANYITFVIKHGKVLLFELPNIIFPNHILTLNKNEAFPYAYGTERPWNNRHVLDFSRIESWICNLDPF